MTTTEDWARVEQCSGFSSTRCILELRARVEALEAQAQAAHKPERAEQGQGAKQLWQLIEDAYDYSPVGQEWAAEIDAVADWLVSRQHDGTAALLRAEAQATREGRRG